MATNKTTYLAPVSLLTYESSTQCYIFTARGTVMPAGNPTTELGDSIGPDGPKGLKGDLYADGEIAFRDLAMCLPKDHPLVQILESISKEATIKKSIFIMLTRGTDDKGCLLAQFAKEIYACKEGRWMHADGHSLGGTQATVFAWLAALSGRFEGVSLNLYGTFPLLNPAAAKEFTKAGIITNNYQFTIDPVPKMNSIAAGVFRFWNVWWNGLAAVVEFEEKHANMTQHVGQELLGVVPGGLTYHEFLHYLQATYTPGSWRTKADTKKWLKDQNEKGIDERDYKQFEERSEEVMEQDAMTWLQERQKKK